MKKFFAIIVTAAVSAAPLKLFAILGIVSLMAVSCDDHEVIIQQTFDFGLKIIQSGEYDSDYPNIAPWNYVSNGQSVVVTFEVDKDHTTDGTKVTDVTFYLDDKEIASTTGLPYTLDYQINNKEIGEHDLEIEFMTNVSGYDNTFHEDYKIYVTKNNPIMRFIYTYPKEFHNGEEFLCQMEISDDTTFEVEITKVEYSWDDKTMFTADKYPYIWTHTFNSEAKGEHTIEIKVYYKGELGDHVYIITNNKVKVVD